MLRKFSLVVILIFVGLTSSYGQIVCVVDSMPGNTPLNDTLFFASSVNGWNPHDTDLIFKKGDGRMYLTLSDTIKQMEFKLCRGNWATVEVNSNGTDIPNRIYEKETGDTIHVKVIAWRDLIPKKQLVSTATKSVRYLPTNMEIPQLGRKRTIRLYLPPNYSSGGAFPVIYMQDGQNLFDNTTAFAGEWKVDEILDSLYTYKGFSAIVVGIYNDEKERINEYSPWKNDSLGIGGDGDKYVKFIVNTLKPFIDRHYRTLPDRSNTFIAGSSMGGLISLYAALEYPDIFGGAAIFSPSIWFSPKIFPYLQKYKRKKNQHLYFMAGEKEGEGMMSSLSKTIDLLKIAGFDDDYYIKVNILPDGRHSEYYWSREFGSAIQYLFNF